MAKSKVEQVEKAGNTAEVTSTAVKVQAISLARYLEITPEKDYYREKYLLSKFDGHVVMSPTEWVDAIKKVLNTELK